MDKKRVDGAIDQAKGKIQKAAGDLTSNKELKAKGQVNEGKGKVETAAGKSVDAVKKATK